LTETILGLLRHGQTDWNIDLRLQGSSDIPLNETGINQATVAGSKLSRADWDVIIASPLSRARDTAQIVAQQLAMPVVIVPELVERSFGVAEGFSHAEWRKMYESNEHIEGLESIQDLRARCELLLQLIATEYDGLRVLAISHGALIRKVLRIVSENQVPQDGDRLGNVSLNKIVHSDGYWAINDYNPKSLAL
jgi:broad specificity phosphatase PhoE